MISKEVYQPPIEEQAENPKEILIGRIRQAISLNAHLDLTSRERNVLGLRLGTNLTLEQIGNQFGVTTREGVRQIEKKALKKLVAHLDLDTAQEILALYRQFNRQRMSEARKRTWQDEDYRQRMSEAMKGRKRSPETRQRMSEARKRTWQDEDYRQRMSEAMKTPEYQQLENKILKLVSAGITKPAKIAEELKIPVGKIYDVLHNLRKSDKLSPKFQRKPT